MKRHIYITRFSAIGDIAISAPLVRAYAEANPDIEFTMVSQPMMKILFEGVDNLHFLPTDFKRMNNSIFSLIKLSKKIREGGATEIADLHNSLRSRVIRLLLSFNGIKSAVIWKSRFKRKALTRRYFKLFQPIATSQRRYEKVFVDLGLTDLNFSKKPVSIKQPLNSQYRKIGIAPFAKHEAKMWPIEKMEKVVCELSSNPNNTIYLFGGKKKEATLLQKWEDRYPNVESAAGKHTLAEELEIIKTLDVMISMDSANMHLASFCHIPVISVWGATHPYAGFYGWGQDPRLAVQIGLACRPCSIYGEKDCFRKDLACLNDITPEMILMRIETLLNGEFS